MQMLTFEEFFKKKKIDLQQLQLLEPALYAEFSNHYPVMGEKSFDYTKKYWFNNLRRLYPLAQEIKPHAVKAEAISEMAIQGIAAAAAQNLDQTLEKPKFKEDHLAELVEENVSVKEVSLAEEEKIITNSEPEILIAKPTFKPRFNMQNIKKEPVKTASKTEGFIPQRETENIKLAEQEPETENPKPETEEAKPVYKPRFQMKNLPKPAIENLPPAAEPE